MYDTDKIREHFRLIQQRERKREMKRRMFNRIIRENIGEEAWNKICEEYNRRLQREELE